MKIKGLLFLLICFTFSVSAQNSYLSSGGARGVALGGASLSNSDAAATYSNSAMLGYLQGSSAQVMAEQRFALSDIRLLAASGVWAMEDSGLGLSVAYFGNEGYNEQRIGLAYGRRLLENFSLGVEVFWLNTSIAEYGSKGAPSFSINFATDLSKELKLGAQIYNPLRTEIIEGEPIPSILKLGLCYSPNEKVQLLAEASKDIDYPIRSHWGLEYEPLDNIFIRAGVATQPTEFSFGTGLLLQKKIMLDISARYHQYLGFTPAMGVGWNFY